MASYDPQRNRPRARPANDDPAPVDALLDQGPPARQPAAAVGGTAITEPVATEPAPTDHGHHDDHDHEHDHGPRPGGVLGAIGALVLAVVTLRMWRRRRRGRVT